MSLKQNFNKAEKNEQGYIFNPEKYPVTILGDKDNKEKAAKSLDVLMQSEMGKELVEAAGQNGIMITFMKFDNGSGYYDSDKKMLVVNSKIKEENAVLTMAHELRHVWQYANGLDESWENDDIKTIILKTRALEADAETVSALVAKQLKDKGFESVYQVGLENEICVKNFDNSFKKNKNVSESLKDVFKGWYKNSKLKDWYDNYFFTDVLSSYDDEDMKNASYSDNVKSSEYMKKLCVINGKNYMAGEKDNLLEHGSFIDISEKAKNALDEYFKKYEKNTGRKADKSYLKLPIRGLENKADNVAIIKSQQTRG